MEAIRQFAKVKNHQVIINLPEDFIAEEVEIIILPKNEFQLSKNQIQLLDDRVNEPESEYIKSTESLNKIRDKYGF